MSNPENTNPGGAPPLLTAAISKLLRPLVRLMLHYQITYPQLIGMLKAIYVDVAETDFQVNGKRQSDSRINLLTGVHRKDVKRLREEHNDPAPPVASASTGAKVIGYWLGSEEYVDSNGNPLPLSLKQTENPDISFEQLVEKVCKQDIRPRVILDEWIRLGIAHLEDDKVVLNTGAFTPEKGFDEKVYFFGKNMKDHLDAGSHNLMGHKPAFFDRSVYYDNLSEDSIQELSELANSLGMQALTEMNKQALQRQKHDADLQDNVFRMNFGVFNFNNADNSNDDVSS